MDKISTKQLLDITIEIVGLADKCHRAGLIDDWQASFSIMDDTNYEFEVRVNLYQTTEMKWNARARDYAESAPENNREQAVALRAHLVGLIEQASAELKKKWDILNA